MESREAVPPREVGEAPGVPSTPRGPGMPGPLGRAEEPAAVAGAASSARQRRQFSPARRLELVESYLSGGDEACDDERAERFAATKTIASGIRGQNYADKPRMCPIRQPPMFKALVRCGLR